MKNKYQRMTEEERKKIRDNYIKSPKGKEMIARLNRILIIGLIGILLALSLVIYATLTSSSIWDYLTAIILLLVSIVFVVKSTEIRENEYNKEALKKK